MNKTERFQKLYRQIQQCKICPKVNSEKVLRRIDQVNITSKVMFIAEAMAPNQVRVSGINYFDKNGNIGNTGKMLEKFLSQFGCSVYPDNPNCIYNTEIVHCLPGYDNKNGESNIRRPAISEITTCIGREFIITEIQNLQPKIIFLMGKTSYESFYTYFLKKERKQIIGLTQKIEVIKNFHQYDSYLGIPLIPIQHASGANPRFLNMTKDVLFINIIKAILENKKI